jgi:5-methylcytosine-specific restriction endonuclease McrA
VSINWFRDRFVARPSAVETACETCGRAMWLPASKAATYKTCGKACAFGTRKAAIAARTRPCETCGTQFTPRSTQLANGGGRFCSQKCNTALREAGHTPEAQAKRTKIRREMETAGLIPRLRGEENPRWKGGREAAVARRIASGMAAAQCRRWRQANPDASRGYSKRRRLKVSGKLEKGTIERIGSSQRWRCGICRGAIRKGYQVDHIKPLALGGQHEARNIQLLCGPCNMRKNAKDPITYMQEIGRLL